MIGRIVSNRLQSIRTTLMTGARPDGIGIIENRAYFRELNPDIITLPQHFIKNGYEAVYCGKIYHGRMTDDQYSWSRSPAWKKLPFKTRPKPYGLQKNLDLLQENRIEMTEKYGDEGSRGLVHGPAFEAADVPDHYFVDGFSTQLAIETLKDHFIKSQETFIFSTRLYSPPPKLCRPKNAGIFDRNDIKNAEQIKGPLMERLPDCMPLLNYAHGMAFPRRDQSERSYRKIYCMVITPA